MAGLTLFDLIVLVIVALSAVFAFARGLVREAMTILSWIGAAAVAIVVYPYVHPLVAQAIVQPQVAVIIAAAGAFLVPLVVLKSLSGMLGRAVDGSSAGFLDKLGGLAFGVARGALVVCALYLGGTFLVRDPAALPWVRDARLLEPVREGASWLGSWLPSDLGGAARAAGDRASRAVDVLRDPASALAPPRPATRPAAEPAYSAEERDALGQLVQQSAR